MRAFRIACGAFCTLLALIFLAANTAILARYGWKSGQDDFERIVNAVVGGSVPATLAMMPFFLAATWIPGRWVERRGRKPKWKAGRPSLMVLVGFALYAVFIAFNFLGAVGSISLQRIEYADNRTASIESTGRLKEQRAQVKAQLDAIPEHRPAQAVEAELRATQLHPWWSATEQCSDNVRNRQRRNYCAEVGKLQAEAANAKRADELLAELRRVDAILASPEARIASADPKSETLATYANLLLQTEGIRASHVRTFEPLVWFALLELACMFLFYMAMLMYGMKGHAMVPEHVEERPVYLPRQDAPALIAAPLPAHVEPLTEERRRAEDPALQAAIYAQFWAQCTRRLAGSREPQTLVYSAYRAFTLRPENRSVAYDLNTFDQLADEHIVARTTTAGVTHYVGVVLSEAMVA